MRQPSALEWLAWAIHAGTDAIEERVSRDNMPFRPPAELKALAHAFVKLAQTDVATDVANSVAGDRAADTDLVAVEQVASELGRSRRTIERRCRDRGVALLNGHVRTEDLEKLK